MAEAKQPSVIVVGVDFEGASQRALSIAKDLGAKLNAEVVIAHVYQIPMFTYPGLEPALLPTFTTEIATAAKRAVAELAASSGGLRAVTREGDAATELLAAAEELNAQMIVLGTHGRSGLSHLFLGSVAEKVMRQSKIPVMTVRASE
jgi:nucleotide-binding universal stress UspA family protein